MQQVVAHRHYMHGLHLAVPGVLVRVHHIKTMACLPPGGHSKPQLVEPARPGQRLRNAVVVHTGPLVIDVLGKNVDLVALCHLLHQRNRIAFSATASGCEDAVEHCDAQPRAKTSVAHALRRSS